MRFDDTKEEEVIHMYCKNVIMSMLSKTLYRIHKIWVYYQGAIVLGGTGPGIGTVYIIIPVPSDSVSRRVLELMFEKMTYMHQHTPMPVIDLVSKIYLIKMYNTFSPTRPLT